MYYECIQSSTLYVTCSTTEKGIVDSKYAFRALEVQELEEKGLQDRL